MQNMVKSKSNFFLCKSNFFFYVAKLAQILFFFYVSAITQLFPAGPFLLKMYNHASLY